MFTAEFCNRLETLFGRKILARFAFLHSIGEGVTTRFCWTTNERRNWTVRSSARRLVLIALKVLLVVYTQKWSDGRVFSLVLVGRRQSFSSYSSFISRLLGFWGFISQTRTKLLLRQCFLYVKFSCAKF